MADTTTTGSTTTDLGVYAEAQVSAAAAGRGEPAWLVRSREEGARAFAATPMPTSALRPWKYTDLSAHTIEEFAPDAAFAPKVTASAPAGGFAGTIADALRDAAQATAMEAALGTVVQATESKFVAANAAHWTGGAFVHAPRGGAFEAPVTVEVTGTTGSIYPRILVVAEANSEVTIIVKNRSTEAPLLVAGVVEIVANDDARVRVLFDGDWGASTSEFTTLRSRLARGADVQVASLALGGRLLKQHIEALIEGAGANSLIRGIALGDADQHFDFVTLQDHMGPKSTSDVEIKSALAGASRSVYYGITRVETTAGGSAANQENRNLLLSDRAKADSDPVLEILTSDVIRCGHGATVGPVDQEALFYLQSRGIDKRGALKLLVGGFFASVLNDAAFEALSEDMLERVQQKIVHADL